MIKNGKADSALYLDSYFDAVFDINIPRKGLRGPDARYVAQALARNQGSAVALSTVAANPAARNPEPSFLAVLVGAGEYARYDREQGYILSP